MTEGRSSRGPLTSERLGFSRVLVANRGEIAVRVIRACRDAGLAAVACYADPDLDAPHTRLADEAYALGGTTAADSYLRIDALLGIAERSGADAVHPGYGFLAESAEFAEAVLGEGLVWIGPPPSAMRALADKVAARQVARSVGAPLAPGLDQPIDDPAEVTRFVAEHGLPIVVKAAHGGGGRGFKVVRTLQELPDALAAARREAVAAFGRDELFVERYLERPRHLETQCLADAHGSVAVISTRDCSVQRRSQKLVEEAPAPFLTAEQERRLRAASADILRAVGYRGAGTCEFLLGADGVLSFLEVNTRLQVEHCVSEEVTGIDLVLEQFRLAAGEPLGYSDPPVLGHAIEFRILSEDPARGFLPQPGAVTGWSPPGGAGVRLDAGVTAGTAISPGFDSLLAKLVVTGVDRAAALARARRALAEFEVSGLATTLPFHRSLVSDPAFAPADPAEPFAVSTRWVEESWLPGQVAVPGQVAAEPPAVEALDARTTPRERIVVEVNGQRVEVVLPPDWPGTAAPPGGQTGRQPGRRPRRQRRPVPAAAAGAVTAPMQGTIVAVPTVEGQQVAAGDPLVVLEAMKMEQPLLAPADGTVTGLQAEVGQQVAAGDIICTIA